MTNNLPTSQNHFDVIIIGSGPGGEGAAMGLTKAGFKVAIIERENSVGGGCTHWGTIPSKSLRHAVSRIIEFNQNPLYCNDTSTLHRTFSQILHHAAEVVSKQTRMRQGFYDRNHCQIIHGCEYASIFRGLGVKVDLINTRQRLLEFLDNEMSDSLSYHLSNTGTMIRNDEVFETIEGTDDGVILHLQSGKKMRADCLLYANGRTGNTDKLALEMVGLKADSRGQLQVNNNYQTTVDHIYAVGDVIGYPSLASAAYDQGRFVAQAISTGKAQGQLIANIPTGIYTLPEISSVGQTEQQLTAAKVPYEVGRSQFKHLARAQIAGTEVGSLKILFHRETNAILGIHCFGERAAEIIHIGQAIMEQKGEGNTIEYFANTTFNYPTMAEAFRVAALNGLNRLF
jgi:NAD(P) transhydrogenase